MQRHDYFTELYGADAFENPANYDAAGNFKPRKRAFMDAAPTQRAGFRRGYAFTDNTIVAQDAREDAARAFEEKRAHLRDAWRNKDTQADAPTPTRTLDELQTIAAGAYEDRKTRLANAWKSR
jgi:hypothetical protein